VDFEEALGDDVPMELWTRQLRGRDELGVGREVFPPKNCALFGSLLGDGEVYPIILLVSAEGR
jgi:hypothetical protein